MDKCLYLPTSCGRLGYLWIPSISNSLGSGCSLATISKSRALFLGNLHLAVHFPTDLFLRAASLDLVPEDLVELQGGRDDFSLCL